MAQQTSNSNPSNRLHTRWKILSAEINTLYSLLEKNKPSQAVRIASLKSSIIKKMRAYLKIAYQILTTTPLINDPFGFIDGGAFVKTKTSDSWAAMKTAELSAEIGVQYGFKSEEKSEAEAAQEHIEQENEAPFILKSGVILVFDKIKQTVTAFYKGRKQNVIDFKDFTSMKFVEFKQWMFNLIAGFKSYFEPKEAFA